MKNNVRRHPDLKTWVVLQKHNTLIRQTSLQSMIADKSRDQSDYELQVGPVYLNFARQRIDSKARELLLAMAGEANVESAIKDLYAGARVNQSEGRAALHTALRAAQPPQTNFDGKPVAQAVKAALSKMLALVDQMLEHNLHSHAARPLADFVNIGIGGSDLGPRLITDALLEAGSTGVQAHFVSSLDSHRFERLLSTLNPETTVFCVTSKSFGTQETLANARLARNWLLESLPGASVAAHFLAVTGNSAAAQKFGVAKENVLPMWDWVGGRFSMWSSAGIGCAVARGNSVYQRLLAGARQMDEHFLNTPLDKNMPVLMALVGIWNRNFENHSSLAIIPYDDRLSLFPQYLQQVEMESTGKTTDCSGAALGWQTGPVIWGSAGSDAQHAYFQALHQGSNKIPVDFVGVVKPSHKYAENHALLLANMLAQAESLANGNVAGRKSDLPGYKHFAGGTPSQVILLDDLEPESLGALCALYEHKVFVASRIWNINPFDQWGVELGKSIAAKIAPLVAPDAVMDAPLDPVTRALLQRLHK